MGLSLRLPKILLMGVIILATAITMLFGPFSQKAEASVSWGQEVTEVARLHLGVKFIYGGTTTKGFDASGYVQYVFSESAAKIKLPRTVKEQYKVGTSVKKEKIKEGDLIFFNSNGTDPTFVGIALGNNQFIAVTLDKGVSIQSLNSDYWKKRFVGAKRVLKQS